MRTLSPGMTDWKPPPGGVPTHTSSEGAIGVANLGAQVLAVQKHSWMVWVLRAVRAACFCTKCRRIQALSRSTSRHLVIGGTKFLAPRQRGGKTSKRRHQSLAVPRGCPGQYRTTKARFEEEGGERRVGREGRRHWSCLASLVAALVEVLDPRVCLPRGALPLPAFPQRASLVRDWSMSPCQQREMTRSLQLISPHQRKGDRSVQ